ncbi:MAG: hypothetical protein NT051_02530 [Candidatus Micrarchaeota archaeon]|nr:hypothetical protein [Candidatus Micrarchaeota archaeon]
MIVKACKNCRFITADPEKCPLCQSVELTEKFSGHLIVLDPEKSEIAKNSYGEQDKRKRKTGKLRFMRKDNAARQVDNLQQDEHLFN